MEYGNLVGQDTSSLVGGGSQDDPTQKIAVLTETNNRLKVKLIEMVKALDNA